MALLFDSVVYIILFVVFVSTVFYVVAVKHFDYWKRRGVYSPKTNFPFGHLKEVFARKVQIGVKLSEIYHEHKNRPYVGLFLLHNKALLVNDLELIKNILVRDFRNFSSHGNGFSPDNDPISKHLFNMSGGEWKQMRVKLTPTFTSSKMKFMFDTILKCTQEMIFYLEEKSKLGKDIDFKETLAKYSTDVIGNCAFGIETNSFKYPDAEFRKNGKKILSTDFLKAFKEMLSFFVPSAIKKFKLRLVPKDVERFLITTVSETIKYRKEKNISRNDFLQLLIDMKNEEEKNGKQDPLKLIEIVAQVYVFFTAGFETSSTTASYAIYELAKNPLVQEKLYRDINNILIKHDGKITYDSIVQMDYLTNVIEETLRMYPPLPFLFRKCEEDYKIPGSENIIENGTMILMPILGIQRDPNIHDAPLEFRPERFSAENKKNMAAFSNLPFGEGPRICIGSRFGIMQIKLGILSIISNYEVSLCNTEMPVKFKSNSIVLTPAENIFFRIKHRKN